MTDSTKTLVQQVGELVAKLRVERELTQGDLAQVSGLSVSYISMIERGLRVPHLSTLESLANALDTTHFSRRPTAPRRTT